MTKRKPTPPFTKEEFERRVEDALMAALVQFYKHNLADANGYQKFTKMWKEDVWHYRHKLDGLLRHPIVGFKSRVKVFNRIIQRMQADDVAYRKIAEQQTVEALELTGIDIPLRDKDTHFFYVDIAFWGIDRAMMEIKHGGEKVAYDL